MNIRNEDYVLIIWDIIVLRLDHRIEVTWKLWRLKSLTNKLFVQQFVLANIKRNIKVPRFWSFVWGIHMWSMDSSRTRQEMRKVFPMHDVIIIQELEAVDPCYYTRVGIALWPELWYVWQYMRLYVISWPIALLRIVWEYVLHLIIIIQWETWIRIIIIIIIIIIVIIIIISSSNIIIIISISIITFIINGVGFIVYSAVTCYPQLNGSSVWFRLMSQSVDHSHHTLPTRWMYI